jgi:hypothetical protein
MALLETIPDYPMKPAVYSERAPLSVVAQSRRGPRIALGTRRERRTHIVFLEYAVLL